MLLISSTKNVLMEELVLFLWNPSFTGALVRSTGREGIGGLYGIDLEIDS